MWTFYNCESVGNSIAIRKESKCKCKTKFLGKRAHFRLETESWKVLKRQVVPTDRTDDFLSITSDPPTKSTYFHLGTVWPQVTTTNSREDMFQLEIDNCSSILYRQNFDILFRFKNVERSIWTSSLQLFFQEG